KVRRHLAPDDEPHSEGEATEVRFTEGVSGTARDTLKGVRNGGPLSFAGNAEEPPQSVLRTAEDVIPLERLAHVFAGIREVGGLGIPVPAQAAAQIRNQIALLPARLAAIANRHLERRDRQLSGDAERERLAVVHEYTLAALLKVRQSDTYEPALRQDDL